MEQEEPGWASPASAPSPPHTQGRQLAKPKAPKNPEPNEER